MENVLGSFCVSALLSLSLWVNLVASLCRGGLRALCLQQLISPRPALFDVIAWHLFLMVLSACRAASAFAG
jgi:hypothetical protein